MNKKLFDYNDSSFAHTISNNMAIDSNGEMIMRISDNVAIDMETGDLHFISGWSDEEEN